MWRVVGVATLILSKRSIIPPPTICPIISILAVTGGRLVVCKVRRHLLLESEIHRKCRSKSRVDMWLNEGLLVSETVAILTCLLLLPLAVNWRCAAILRNVKSRTVRVLAGRTRYG